MSKPWIEFQAGFSFLLCSMRALPCIITSLGNMFCSGGGLGSGRYSICSGLGRLSVLTDWQYWFLTLTSSEDEPLWPFVRPWYPVDTRVRILLFLSSRGCVSTPLVRPIVSSCTALQQISLQFLSVAWVTAQVNRHTSVIRVAFN